MSAKCDLFHNEYLSFLYVFRVRSPTCGTEYIKIGKTTTNLMERYATHSTSNHYELNIHMTFGFKEGVSAVCYEGELHRKMNDFLVRGEWYIYNQESKKLLLESVLKIKDNHYDIRKSMLARARTIPNIDYEIDVNPFINNNEEIKNELTKKSN